MKIFGHIKKKQYLCSRFRINHVFLAQLVEQLTLNQWVQGSSPWEDTKGYPKGYPFFVLLRDEKPPKYRAPETLVAFWEKRSHQVP